ncbi:hypothetical protein ACMFMG_009065 [Clarireedia jacksonii]
MARQSEHSKNAVLKHRSKVKEDVGTPTKVSVDRSSTTRSPRMISKIAKNPVHTKRATKTILVKPIIKSSVKDIHHSTKYIRSSRKPKSKHVRVRKPSDDSDDLESAFHNSLEGAREHILRSGEEGFDNVHQKLVQRLDAGRVKDKAFLEKVSGVAEILSAPMADEKVETTVLKNGKRVVQIVEIGKRIADFKKNIGNEEEKLDDYWKRYELLQLEFEELGVQVLGARALKVAEDKYDEEGYRHEVDLLEKEHCTKMEEIMEELGEIGDEAIKKMRASEKEIDAVAGKERGRLLLAFME